MSDPDPASSAARGDPPAGDAGFLTTHWSVVLAAGDRDDPASRAALASLCRSYWYPLYAFVRRRGANAEDARDLTQGFFARLIEKRDLAALAPERGRFRAFLLAALKHYLANEHERASAQKRGGGSAPLSIELAAADSKWRIDPGHALTPERLFEKSWALALLEHTLDGLRAEYETAGKAELFAALKPQLEGSGAPYAELAQRLGTTEGALKVAAHRLRRRYRERLRAEIGRTVGRPEEVEGEIGDLFRILGN
jgi:RNA polymerase sigma-70 factor (ECF subfamily)